MTKMHRIPYVVHFFVTDLKFLSFSSVQTCIFMV